MNAKCPVCDYPIDKGQVEVRTGDKVVVVCCEECAEKLRHERKAAAPN